MFVHEVPIDSILTLVHIMACWHCILIKISLRFVPQGPIKTIGAFCPHVSPMLVPWTMLSGKGHFSALQGNFESKTWDPSILIFESGKILLQSILPTVDPQTSLRAMFSLTWICHEILREYYQPLVQLYYLCNYVMPGVGHLTHWGWENMAAVLKMAFSIACSWMKNIAVRFKFHWNVFLGV